MSETKALLTAAIAEAWANGEGAGELCAFTEMEDAAADLLSKAPEDWELRLGALTSLSDTAADALSKYSGILDLSGLESLPESTAAKLAQHRGLLLLRLESVPDAVADALSKIEGMLVIEGLASLTHAGLAKKLIQDVSILDLGDIRSLSDEIADIISQFRGELHMDGLVSLTHLGLARKLNERGVMGPYYRLTELSAEAAEEVAKEPEENGLDLDTLTSLSDEAAEALSKHRGVLCLSGLTSISEAAAESLSKHKGDVLLGGLTSISEAAAEALSRIDGDVHLWGEPRERVGKYKAKAAERLAEQEAEAEARRPLPAIYPRLLDDAEVDELLRRLIDAFSLKKRIEGASRITCEDDHSTCMWNEWFRTLEAKYSASAYCSEGLEAEAMERSSEYIKGIADVTLSSGRTLKVELTELSPSEANYGGSDEMFPEWEDDERPEFNTKMDFYVTCRLLNP